MGVLLSEPEIFLRQADVGPSADKQPEVWSASPLTPLPPAPCVTHIFGVWGSGSLLWQSKEFRAFWGSKAELRRFKDGTITETAGG